MWCRAFLYLHTSKYLSAWRLPAEAASSGQWPVASEERTVPSWQMPCHAVNGVPSGLWTALRASLRACLAPHGLHSDAHHRPLAIQVHHSPQKEGRTHALAHSRKLHVRQPLILDSQGFSIQALFMPIIILSPRPDPVPAHRQNGIRQARLDVAFCSPPWPLLPSLPCLPSLRPHSGPLLTFPILSDCGCGRSFAVHHHHHNHTQDTHTRSLMTLEA